MSKSVERASEILSLCEDHDQWFCIIRIKRTHVMGATGGCFFQ